MVGIRSKWAKWSASDPRSPSYWADEIFEELPIARRQLANVSAPADLGYPPSQHDAEYLAEAFRAYMAYPSYMKTVAPAVARHIRGAVNSHPELSKIIQFNSDIGLPSLFGSALSPYTQDQEHVTIRQNGFRPNEPINEIAIIARRASRVSQRGNGGK